jgi:hypothetical protein
MVTAAVYERRHLLSTPEHKDLMLDLLFQWSEETRWILRAWAIPANHYHFLATAVDGAANLREMLRRLHGKSAIELNRLNHSPGRQVWHQSGRSGAPSRGSKSIAFGNNKSARQRAHF